MPQEELKRGAHFAKESAPQTPSSEASSSRDDTDDMGSSDYSTVGRSAGLMTILTIVSRVTGFIRTWAMAAAIGMSLLSSSYQVANNLPNMLYELVMGGMLVTAFLPVYMGVRREQGREASNEYVGNLLGILLLVLGGISLLGTVFAPGFIWTQSFLSGDGGSMDTAAFMFRFFAIQILFYGLGSVFSGVLNAHRDYFWSTFAPVLNNVIVIASFMGFAPVSAQFGERAGIILIAAGTTLGVFVQMACQIPALGKHGVHPHIHIDFKDHALRQRFHDTRTLARVEFALVAVLKLLQCSTRQVVGVLLEHLFLCGLDLGERRLNGDDERLGATEYVGLVGGNERVDGADHLAASILALGALKELDAACGASRHGDRHAATREVLTRRATHGTRGHGGRHQPKRHALAAAHDGGQHHVRRGAQQDEHNALGRLLECLEQCVGGVGAQLLGTVDDVDLGLGADGRQRHVIEQLAGLGDEVARGALGRVIVHVGVRMAGDAHAAIA